MGKADKQHANRINKQMTAHKADADFINMITAMDPKKSYSLKKGKVELYGGKSMPGWYWKQLFITETKSEEP